MPENIGKVIFALVIQLGDMVPFTILMSFSSQLCVQLGLEKLGIFILLMLALSSILGSLVAPAFIKRFGLKRNIVVASFGMA